MGTDRIHGHLADVATAGWARDLYALDVQATDPRWEEVGGKQVFGYRDCIQNRRVDSQCAGMSNTVTRSPRASRRVPLCEKHWADRSADRGMPAHPGTAGTIPR